MALHVCLHTVITITIFMPGAISTIWSRIWKMPPPGWRRGALASVLERTITLLQGDALGRPYLLLARYVDGAVQVGVRATRSAA